MIDANDLPLVRQALAPAQLDEQHQPTSGNVAARRPLLIANYAVQKLYRYGYNVQMTFEMKPIVWIGSSKKDLLALPEPVVDVFGYGLHLAQVGGKHPDAKPLGGFGSAGILELVEDWRGDTYRAVYTVRFKSAIYVLHVFQKKSKHGVATPKADMELIRERLKLAEAKAKE